MIHKREDCVTRTISMASEDSERKLPPVYATITVKSKDGDAAERLAKRLGELLEAELEKT